MALRGIRGAITCEANDKAAIVASTKELLQDMMAHNAIVQDDIASIFFSVTDDLDAEFPAVAARQLGFSHTPLLCLNEIPVVGSLASCIRILLHVNTQLAQVEMTHSYLKGATVLRPDVVR